jgi:hypothetical protein
MTFDTTLLKGLLQVDEETAIDKQLSTVLPMKSAPIGTSRVASTHHIIRQIAGKEHGWTCEI